MSEDLNKVEVFILDERYVLKGNEPAEYMEMVALQVNKRLQQVQNMNPRLSTVQTAILTSINILDELLKLRNEYQGLLDLLEESGEKNSKVKK
ncbi:MAG: cell division protein ZapA [Bacillota bacterium]